MWAEIGRQLRQARESAGLSFEEIRDKTQIDSVSLRALENGDFEKLGSPFTVRSYIRAYAKQVGLEPTYLLKQYRQLEQTGVLPVIDSDSASASSPGQPQGTGHMPSHSSASPPPDYDPFKNHPARQTNRIEAVYDSNASMAFEEVPALDQPLPSRSDTGSRGAISKITERLKLPSLKKENSGKHRTPEGGFEEAGGYEDWTTPESGRRSARQRRAIVDRKASGRYHYSDGYHEDEAGGEDVGTWEDHQGAYHIDTGWEGYSETAAGIEEPAASWDESEPRIRRSGQRLSQPQRSVSGHLSPVSSNERESGWHDLQTPSRSGRQRSVIPVSTTSGSPALLGAPLEAGSPARNGRRRKVSERGKIAGKWLTKKRWILVVAAIILLIPVSVLAYNNMKGESEEAQTATDGSQGDAASGTSAQGVAAVISMNQTPTLGEYKLSEPDIMSFTFKATGSSSWIQIREQQNPDDGYIKDFTLQPGEEYPYHHGKDASNDVWVTIGNPENVTLTINGQEVETTKSVHVSRE